MIDIEDITLRNWDELKADVMRSEMVYPESIQAKEDEYTNILHTQGSVAKAIKVDGRYVGNVFGCDAKLLQTIGEYDSLDNLLSVDAEKTIHVNNVVIDTPYQEQGYAKRLLQAFIAEAQKKGYTKLVGFFRPNNSLPLIKSMGGKEVKVFKDWWNTGEDYVFCELDISKGLQYTNKHWHNKSIRSFKKWRKSFDLPDLAEQYGLSAEELRDLVDFLVVCALTPAVKRRQKAISELLKQYDLSQDGAGNMCVKNEDKPAIIVTSHMDTVFSNKYNSQRISFNGSKIKGTLDNSIGCAINAALVKYSEPGVPVWHYFTVGEEDFGVGAKRIAANLEIHDKKPDLAVAIDVTYPSGNAKQRCIIENIIDLELGLKIRDFIKSLDSNHVSMRPGDIFDESWIFRKCMPAMAAGPVVYGDFHSAGAYTTLENIATTYSFLKKLLKNWK